MGLGRFGNDAMARRNKLTQFLTRHATRKGSTRSRERANLKSNPFREVVIHNEGKNEGGLGSVSTISNSSHKRKKKKTLFYIKP